MNQFLITPAMGKRLIAKALLKHPYIMEALKSKTLAIIAGTTNGYVAEEILKSIGQVEGFNRQRFFRGLVTPPEISRSSTGRLKDVTGFPGDVIIREGVWDKGKTIFDVVDNLKRGDVILKGANALDPARREAAIYIGDPRGGTILTALQSVVGRRVKLILPVGLEKRVFEDLHQISLKLNDPSQTGPRMLTVSGEVFTEIDAIKQLTGCSADLIAGGGVSGAEGSVWLLLEGSKEDLLSAKKLLDSVSGEKQFQI
ncbi:MAG: hypothetical protein QME14_07100 [Methanobacteriaceae archaeon]|nr:hypothetical protein [Methanobacteriaceae archaeon]